MSYEPSPGSVPYRVLAHMELLHKGSEITTGMLGTALGVDSNGLATQLGRAVEARLLFVRQKGGHLKSPKFWSLVDHSTDGHAAPPPGPQTPMRKVQPIAATSDDDDAPRQVVTKAQPGATDLQIRETVQANRETNPLQNVWSGGTSRSNGIDIDDVHRTRDRVIDMDAPAPEALIEAAQINGKESSEDHAEQRSRAADPPSPSIARAMKVRQLRTTSRPAPVPEGMRQLTPDNTEDIRVALWSDGTLEIRAFDSPTIVLRRQQARQLVDYLNAIDLDVLEVDEAA